MRGPSHPSNLFRRKGLEDINHFRTIMWIRSTISDPNFVDLVAHPPQEKTGYCAGCRLPILNLKTLRREKYFACLTFVRDKLAAVLFLSVSGNFSISSTTPISKQNSIMPWW